MADEILTAIDTAFASRARERPIDQHRSTVVPFAAQETAAAHPIAEPQRSLWERTEWVEAFFAVQFLWGALMFIPGAQQFRSVVRALPYLSSLVLLGMYLMCRVPVSLPGGGGLLISALLLLVVNLLHSTSQISSGLAQCVFQLSIAAPLFWAYKAVRSPKQLERLIVLVFLMNFASAGLGVLQVYYPEQFMPREFSSLGLQMNQYYVDSLTYVGNNGRAIIRPPGLTDQPGGAAIAGALTALLGLGLLFRAKRPLYVVGVLAAVSIGLAVVYLTQVRSVLLIAIAAGGVLAAVALARGRVAGATWILLTGGGLVVASFLWASSLGGESVDSRFLNLRGRGALQAYQDNRGNFLAYTLDDLLSEFPLGAGVGRWGMMNAYFGNPAAFQSSPIHVEIQLTGWLLDGGVPMWFLYGGAALLSLWAAFQMTGARDPRVADLSLIVLSVQVFVVGVSFAGPAFNTQLGVLFWAVASAAHGAATSTGDSVTADALDPAADN